MESNEPTVIPEPGEEALHQVTGAAFNFGWSRPEQIGLGGGAAIGGTAAGTAGYVAAKKGDPQHTGLATGMTGAVGLLGGAAAGYVSGSLYKDLKGAEHVVGETTPLIRR